MLCVEWDVKPYTLTHCPIYLQQTVLHQSLSSVIHIG